MNGNFGGGNGTVNNPILIEDVADFKALNNWYASDFEYIKQVNDLDFNNEEFDNSIVNQILKNYDGNNKKILNINIKDNITAI